MNNRIRVMRTAAIFALLALSAGAALAQGNTLVVVPLHTTGDIPPAIGDGFRAHLRGLTEGKATVLDPSVTATALSTAGASSDCATDACAVGIAGASGARFVLSGAVDNTDEIYKVSLRLYDALEKTSAASQGVCELCAAEEVDRTIGVAFAELQGALARPAPAAAAPRVAIEVITRPPGADITLAGAAQGKSPIVLRVAPGEHRIGASMTGRKPAERTVQARQDTIKLSIELVEAAPAAIAPPVTPPVTAPVTPPVTAVVPPTTAGDDEDGGYLYTGAGMLIGGSLLTAGGIYAILLDGDITCSDGLGRRECPTVYNTKGVGMIALGLGAGLLGAGATLVIVDLLGDPQVAPTAVITPDGAVMGFGGRF